MQEGRCKTTVAIAAARTVIRRSCIINAAAESLKKKTEIFGGFATAAMTIHNCRGALTDEGGHLHLGLMLGQLRVEK